MAEDETGFEPTPAKASPQNLLQLQRHAAVLPDEQGHTQPVGAPDGFVQRACLPDMQVHPKVRMTGQNVQIFGVHPGGSQLIDGVEGVRAEMTAENGDFQRDTLLCFFCMILLFPD